jgi:phthalate 4,5-cis-dihydrodiol dehydrogenase
MANDPDVDGRKKLRLGVVGFGAASRLMLDPLTTDGNCEVVAAADPDPVVRATFSEQWKAAACESAEELYENFDLDAVYIAAPTKFHEGYAVSALDHGIHVLVEKPMALTIESALAMIDAAKRNDRVLMECHKRSVDRPIATMWKLISGGLIGQPRVVHRLHYSSWFYRPRAEEERDPSAGGIVLRQGAHEFDIIRMLAQSAPTRVWGWTGDYDVTRPGEGSYMAWVEFDDGTRATSTYSGYDHFDTTEFTSGPLESDEIGKTWRKILEAENGVDEGELKRRTIEPRSAGARRDDPLFGFTLVNGELGDLRPAPGNHVYLYGSAGRREFSLDGPAGTYLIAREFYEAIAENAPVVHSGAWGLAVLELCLAVRRSAASGGESVPLVHQYDVPSSTIEAVIGKRDLSEV